jgi:hypothetical protein
MRRAATILGWCALAGLAPACGRQAARVDASAAAPAAAAAADTLPHRFVRTLAGTVGEEPLEVWLRREDGRLNGSWRDEDGELWISGTIGSGGAVSLQLEVPDGAAAASVDGVLTMGPGGVTLRGRLLEPGEEPLAVELVEKRAALSPSVTLVPRTWVDEDAERGWSIQAEIPTAVAAAGAELEPAYLAFNAAVDSLVQQDIAPFRAMLLEHEPMPGFEGGSSYESSYEVMLVEEGIASLAFDASVYMSGAAHPNHASWTLTWDFDAGRRVVLDELFRSGTPYLQTLSDYAVPVLQEQLAEIADAAWIEDGAAPTAENYARWSLTPEGLRIVFDPYQVAPYAAGPREVVVRWSALEPLLDPAGPGARIVR